MATRFSPAIRARIDRAVAAGDPAPARPHHRALATAADVPAGLLYRLAMLEARGGEIDAAIRLLEAARSRAPRDPDLLANLGQLKLGRGDAAGALACFDALDAGARGHATIARLRGDALTGLGRPADAAVAYEQALLRAPDDADLHANLGAAYRALGRPREAIRHLETALTRRPSVEARVTLAGLLVELDQADQAVGLLIAGLKPRADSAVLQRQLAAAFRAAGDFSRSLSAARRAALLDPSDPSAGAAVGELAENRADIDAAASWARRVLILDRRHLAGARLSVRVDRRRRRLEDALGTADRWLAGETAAARRHPILFERAQVLEALGRPCEAFDAFAAANGAQLAALPSLPDPERAHRQIAALAGLYAEGVPVVPAAAELPGDDGPAPLFLIGFPRSGTTLLDQVLNAHPDIAVVEERPLVPGLIARLAAAGRPYPESLATLTAADRADLRAHYRAEMARFLPAGPTRYAVDKMPLNLVHAGLIRALFPEARFLLALRHPCDVVLSCFMQSFQLNTWMAALTSLEGAARLYRASLGVWETYVDRFDPPRIAVRYEDLVDDLPGEAARLLDFLGLPWHDGVLRFDEHARGRGVLMTPSAAQVTQPIYRSALARWRRYDFVMNAVAGSLAEEIRRYGYDTGEERR